MNIPRDPDTVLAAWLDDGPLTLPNETRQAIAVGIRTVPRRRPGFGLTLGGARLGLPDIGLRRVSMALGGAAVVVVAAAVALDFYVNQPGVGGLVPPGDPRISFLGTWFTRDADGSAPTMTVRASGEEALEIVVLDDLASVCSGAPSTMTGTGRLEAAGELVIPSPVYTCDDGSEPQALNGPPLAQQLRNLTFVLDRQAQTLTDNLGSVWSREGAQPPSPQQPGFGPVWPQTSLEELRRAQELADAGDPRYTWQVDGELREMPSEDTAIVVRFLREVLGWEAFQFTGNDGFSWGSGVRSIDGITYIRCAPGETNPLYPSDPAGRGCAPTIDDVRYEQVRFGLAQLIRQDPTGIWVITRWAMLPSFEQAVPPTEAETIALLEDFLQARLDGRGAERYVDVPNDTSPSQDVPLLYATSSGARYERGEFEIVEGPFWPTGWTLLRMQLVADGGATVVKQRFVLEPPSEGGRLLLHYEFNPRDAAPTTENGQPVLVQYRFPGDEVTFSAAWPWYRNTQKPQLPRLITLETRHEDPALYDAGLVVVADPRPIERGCQEGPAPADAAALARSIASDPDLDATAPVAATFGGLPALQMDVVTAPGTSACDTWAATLGEYPLVMTGGLLGESARMRLYLLDLPGASPRILAIALTAPNSDFERVMELEAPLLESFQFDPR